MFSRPFRAAYAVGAAPVVVPLATAAAAQPAVECRVSCPAPNVQYFMPQQAFRDAWLGSRVQR